MPKKERPLMTECIQESFSFTAHFSRRVQAEFTAGRVSSDGGALLLREADRRINLLGRLASFFLDGRAPLLVKHRLSEMLSQRIYGLALGYEDLCDHEQLRSDPLLGVLSGKRELDEPLAGKSTLNRLELIGRSKRYHKISYSTDSMDRLLTDLYLESHAAPPEQIVLDLDATDIPLYGHQPERFFHGYYDSYCYLPLYIFAGHQLLCARLRPANQDAAKGSVEEVSRIVAQLRQRWAAVKIVLRADSGFCREELMSWAEQTAGKDHRRPDAAGPAPAPQYTKGGPGLRRVQLPDSQKLVLRTPRSGQGGVSRKGREPALRGHLLNCRAMGRAGSIRKVLLRKRRDGEPDQRTDVPVRRPALHR